MEFAKFIAKGSLNTVSCMLQIYIPYSSIIFSFLILVMWEVTQKLYQKSFQTYQMHMIIFIFYIIERRK